MSLSLMSSYIRPCAQIQKTPAQKHSQQLMNEHNDLLCVRAAGYRTGFNCEAHGTDVYLKSSPEFHCVPQRSSGSVILSYLPGCISHRTSAPSPLITPTLSEICA